MFILSDCITSLSAAVCPYLLCDSDRRTVQRSIIQFMSIAIRASSSRVTAYAIMCTATSTYLTTAVVHIRAAYTL
jgi:hypothetical protein